MLWASVMHHELAVRKLDKPPRHLCNECPRGPMRRPRVTHVGTANGMTMTSGCEWHMQKWLRDTLKMRRARSAG